MKKIINGKLYDTATAQRVGCLEHGDLIDDGLHYVEENLYRKRTGEFFLYRVGGAATDCCDGVIEPIGFDAAKRWAEQLDGDDYVAIFGEPEESDDRKTISLTINAEILARVKQAASKSGETLSGWMEAAAKDRLAN